jgi:hypothetical protein
MTSVELSEKITASLAKHVSESQNKRKSDLISSIKFYDERFKAWETNASIEVNDKIKISDFWTKLLPSIDVVFGVEKYCNVTGRFYVDYIHDGIFYSLIDPFFNNQAFAFQFDNKAYYPLLFADVNMPRTIALRLNGCWLDSKYTLLSLNEVLESCLQEKKIVIKFCRYSSGGNGVIFKNNIQRNELKQFFLSTNVDVVIQEVVEQHPELSKLHAASVNTIRIMTLLWNNEVIILSSVLRMGIGSAVVDNASTGGIVCGIKSNGELKNVAFDKNGYCYNHHPQGASFDKIVIPNYNAVKQFVKKLQSRFPYCRMISWDIAIDPNGQPILIEPNLSNGELDFHQFCNGSIFGDLTKQIIEKIIENNL